MKTWQLFAICVLVWGTTWHAITYQLGQTTPAVGVALRFGLAGLAILAWQGLRGQSLRFDARTHGFFALQGSLLYGVSYICVYWAEKYLPSGLVSVGYSASPLIMGVAASRLFGQTFTGRFVVGGLMGVAGVVLIFWPEFQGVRDLRTTLLGVAFTAGSVLLSAGGSLAASRNAVRGLPLWPSLGFGMVYGALACAVVALIGGDAFSWPTALSWWLSLAYLAFVGSVLAFSCYLVVQYRIGPGPAGAIGVMTPIVALAVSTAFEGYQPTMLTLAGAAVVVAGNALMLRR